MTERGLKKKHQRFLFNVYKVFFIFLSRFLTFFNAFYFFWNVFYIYASDIWSDLVICPAISHYHL